VTRLAATTASLVESGPVLSDRDLTFIVKLVYDRAGIRLHDGKRELITARLQKRLRLLGRPSAGAGHHDVTPGLGRWTIDGSLAANL